jgi:hypothetical protein
MSLIQLLSGRDRKTSARRRPRAFRPSTRPVLEDLESRVVLSAPAAVAPLIQPPINILPQLSVTKVVPVGNTLNAIVALGNQTISVPLTLTTTPNSADPSCPILNLHLGPIHLNLLGLNVDTSEICLSVTAHEGGGLLGDLLCSVSSLLEAGTPLSSILGGLSTTQLNTVLSGLTGLLNGALGAATTTSATPAVGQATPAVHDTSPGACDLLDLSLAPIDLTLLGLNVHLDNCAHPGGPVTVDITAVPSGGLLGDLLCSLDNLLTNGHASTRAVDRLLTNIAKEINTLV